MNISLLIIFAFLALSVYLGIGAKKGKTMSFEQWTVGGRGFGTIFVFVLMAGEIYTTFTFLGGSGAAYGRGIGALFVLSTIPFVMSYWLLPAIWKYAKEHKSLSQSDFFVSKYNSPALGVLVSIVGVVAMIPYLVLQLKGLGIIVSEASYGTISPAAAIWIGVISVTVYVIVSGVHGSARTAVVKDIMILAVVAFMGLYLPIHYYGGFQQMFQAINDAQPGLLTLPDKGPSTFWMISTILLNGFGFFMWPHAFAAAFTAKNERALRRNAAFMPIYQLVLLFVLFVGFAAILQVPGLKGPDTDLALFKLAKATFDPWFVGVIGAAGLLTAIVPGSLLLMAAATLITKNIYKVWNPKSTDEQLSKLSRYMVPVVALVSLYFTFNGGSTIVALWLMGYNLVTQLFPSLLCSLWKNNPINARGAFSGIIAGVATVAYVTISKTTVASLFPAFPQSLKDINIGIVALIVNLCVMFVVSAVIRNAKVAGQKSSAA